MLMLIASPSLVGLTFPSFSQLIGLNKVPTKIGKIDNELLKSKDGS
jgi:hypothetical protein